MAGATSHAQKVQAGVINPGPLRYHTQEISNAVHSMLACASLFKQGGDENTAALLSVLAHHIDENLGEIKALTLPREDE